MTLACPRKGTRHLVEPKYNPDVVLSCGRHLQPILGESRPRLPSYGPLGSHPLSLRKKQHLRLK